MIEPPGSTASVIATMPTQYQLSTVDYTVLATLGLAVVAITLRCARKTDTTECYRVTRVPSAPLPVFGRGMVNGVS